MGLRIVLHQQQSVTMTALRHSFRVCAAPIEVHQQQGAGAGCDVTLYQLVVQFQRVVAGFHQNRTQPVFGNGEDGSHKGIGRYQHLVTFAQYAQLLIGTEDERQRIEAVAAADAMSCANVVGVVLLKSLRGLTVQIPTAADDFFHGLNDFLLVQGVYFL